MPEFLPLYKPPPRELGGLERVFRHLDRPGLAVRSLLEGKLAAAAKNVVNLLASSPALGLYGPEDVPVLGDWWKKHLATTPETDSDD